MTKKQKCFELLDKQNYILDQQAFEIFGGEEGMYLVYPYKNMWRKLQADKNFFKDKIIVEKRKSYRCHLVRVKGMEENAGYKVGKDFYDTVVV